MNDHTFQTLLSLGASFLGGIIGGGAVIWQTRSMLNAQNEQREADGKREAKSIAVALLWEIDDFYRTSIANVNRALKNATPSNLGFYVRPQDLRSFTVFEATAGKIGLFEPALVQAVVGFYGQAKAYRDTLSEYGNVMQDMVVTGNRQKYVGRAVTLLDQIKKSAVAFVPITQTVCEALAERAGAKYKFELPYSPFP